MAIWIALLFLNLKDAGMVVRSRLSMLAMRIVAMVCLNLVRLLGGMADPGGAVGCE
jgi:hypothetical protein